jgi:hypothetical protein
MASYLGTKRSRHLILALTIGGLLYLVYLLTFSGTFKTDDELYIADTAQALSIRHSLYLNQSAYLRPLQTTDVELAQPILAIPFYWPAYHIPWVGNIHAILLFNPAVTALTAVLLFYYALSRGYRERTAVVAALLFGLTTIVWPYTKTFFREPLSTLNLLGAAFCLENWRRAVIEDRHRHWLWLAGGTGLTVLALLSKEAALIFLPALLLMAYPGQKVLKGRRREMLLIGIGLAVAALLLLAAVIFFRERFYLFRTRYQIPIRLRTFVQGLPGAWYGMAGYLISPGKGIWWYSPILLLALGAPFALPHSRWRESGLPLALTLWFALSYAAVRQGEWHGGVGWGARYMLPLIPFLMLTTLPLLERMLNSTQWWPKAILALMAAAGLAVQIGGVYVNIHSYYGYMQPATGFPAWIGPGIWSVRWSQAVGSLLFLPQAESDVRWLIPQPDWLALGVIVIGIAGMIALLVRCYRRQSHPRWLVYGVALLVPVAAVAVSLFGLWRAYSDPRYDGHNQSLHALNAYLQENATHEDAILLSSPNYVHFFLNYYKGDAIWYSLPYSPGERYSWEQEPQVVSDQVEELIDPEVANMAGWVNANAGPLWLVQDSSPYLPWAVRPVEWYLSKYMFPISFTDFDPTVRLIEYLPLLYAPPDEAEPAHLVMARFGNAIELVGYDLVTHPNLSSPSDLHTGDMLGVSLVWRAMSRPDADYVVGMYWIDANGALALQQDRPPMGGFAPTSRWEQGGEIRDNFGFILPAALPPGRYELWVALYAWPSLERLPVAGADGLSLGDHAVLGVIEVR